MKITEVEKEDIVVTYASDVEEGAVFRTLNGVLWLKLRNDNAVALLCVGEARPGMNTLPACEILDPVATQYPDAELVLGHPRPTS